MKASLFRESGIGRSSNGSVRIRGQRKRVWLVLAFACDLPSVDISYAR